MNDKDYLVSKSSRRGYAVFVALDPIVVFLPRVAYRPGPIRDLDRLLSLKSRVGILPGRDARGGEGPRPAG